MEILEIHSGTLDDGKFPQVLYKYRDWNTEFHDRFIKNREIFMAQPYSFEDEFDCKIPIRYELLTEKETLEFAIRYSKETNPHWTRQQHRKDAREWNKQKLFKNLPYIESHRKKYFDGYNERLGVLSLTADPCNEEMWKKYSNNSTGFCVGYNARVMFDFLGGGGEVHYVDELPLIFPEPKMSHHQIRATQVFSKLKKWSFEKEYRTMSFWENPATIKERQKPLPKEAFHSVIFGKNISAKDRIDITEAIRINIGNISIIEQNNVC